MKHKFSLHDGTKSTKQQHFWIYIYHIPLIYKRNLGTNIHLLTHRKHTWPALINAGPCVKQNTNAPSDTLPSCTEYKCFPHKHRFSLSRSCSFQSAHRASAIETFVAGLLAPSCKPLYPVIYMAWNKITVFSVLPLQRSRLIPQVHSSAHNYRHVTAGIRMADHFFSFHRFPFGYCKA